MKFLSSIKNNFTPQWKQLTNKEASCEQRIFAGLELVCFPVSLITLFVLLPLQIIASKANWQYHWLFFDTCNILISAAIGYITNFIAIEMLFKPYTKNKFHLFSIITLGYWKEGLIPKNKKNIGIELGHQIESKLLNPETLANELCDMVLKILKDPNILEKLCNSIQDILHTHEKAIIEFLAPQIENSLTSGIDQIVTKNNIITLWNEDIEPIILKDENRQKIALQICSNFQGKTPQITLMLKEEFQKLCYDYLINKLPFASGAKIISSGFIDFIDWKNIETRLKSKINDESTINMLKDEIKDLIIKQKNNITSPENTIIIDNFIAQMKTKLKSYIHSYLNDELSNVINKMANSTKMTIWVEESLIPAITPKIEHLLRTEGKDKVIETLNLANRVAESVDKQDVKEFHNMINLIAAQHLGAIQVLGFLLGLIIGLVQLFI